MGRYIAKLVIARCPVHGLHGERAECFVCGRAVEQVPMVPADEDAIERLAQYLYDTDDSRERSGETDADGWIFSQWVREPDGLRGLYRERARGAVAALESYS